MPEEKEIDLFLPTDAHCAICQRWIKNDSPAEWTALIREDGTAEPIHTACIPVKAENLEWRPGTLKLNADGQEHRA